jgi:hypothetical protein
VIDSIVLGVLVIAVVVTFAGLSAWLSLRGPGR